MSAPTSPLKTAGTAAAHELAATLERLGLEPPASEVLCVARLEDRRLRIVVSITEIKEGEAKLILTPLGRQILGDIGVPVPAPILTPLHRQIVSVLDRVTPRKAAWIAAKLKRACGGSFRSTLAELVRSGVLRRDVAGYLLA